MTSSFPFSFYRSVVRTVLFLCIFQINIYLATANESTIPMLSPLEQAQSLTEELEFLKEESVAIAVRHLQPISETPSNVYIITDEDIRHSGATDLPTILRRIPGIEVSQLSGSEFNVSARGDNQQDANKLLVLIDGRSVYFDIQGGYFWKGIPVTLPEIKRIEVLKGPASSLYGFNAFDGVINIITKSPEEMNGTTVQFGGGEFGTLTAAAIQAGTFGPFSYRLSGGRDQTNQWRNREALSFRAHKFNLHTEYSLPNSSKILVEGGFMDANQNEGPFIEVATPNTDFSDGYARVGYERPHFFIRSWFRRLTFFSDVQTDSRLASFGPGGSNGISISDRNGVPNRHTRGDTFDIEAQQAMNLGTLGHLTYGINYRHNTMKDNFIDSFSKEDRLGMYLQNEWKPFQPVTVVAGLRVDLHSEINPTYSPRLALVVKPHPDHSIRIAGSLAYRPPTLNQTNSDLRTITTLFGVPCNPALVPPPCPFPVKGNNNLDPEQIISYEAGYQGWFFKHRLRGRLDLFFNHLSDLIRSAGGTFANDRGSADIYGGEVGLEYLATPWLTGFVNYAFQDIGQNFTGDALRGAPRSKVNVGLRGEWENGLSSEMTFHHVGPARYRVSGVFTDFSALGVIPPNPRVRGYNLLNLRGAYRFWKERAEVSVSVFNALNDKHREHPLGDQIKRRVMGWLTIRF